MIYSIDRGFHSHLTHCIHSILHYIHRDVHSYLAHFTPVTFTRYSFHSSLPSTLPSYEKDSSRIFLQIKSRGRRKSQSIGRTSKEMATRNEVLGSETRMLRPQQHTIVSNQKKKIWVVCGNEFSNSTSTSQAAATALREQPIQPTRQLQKRNKHKCTLRAARNNHDKHKGSSQGGSRLNI